ncbi:MAG: GNAT family N-acetyltransferase, partial [Acidimicrobiales bacterium]
AGVRFAHIGLHLEASVPTADRGELPLAAFVAGDPPVGFVWLMLVGGQAHVEAIAMAPGSGRQGIGRALLERACEWAQGAGYRRVTLCTFRDVPWNGPFYRSAGFEDLPEKEWCDELTALRATERANGLDEEGPRVVMVRALRSVPTTGSTTPGGR